jgi:lipopolysaccharide exporter
MTSKSKISRLLFFLGRSDGSLSRRIFRSGVFVLVSTLVVNLLTLVRQIVLARLLFPEAFGVMSICAIVLRGVNVFTEMGLAPALIHRQQGFEEAKDTAFTMSVLRGVALALVLFSIAPFVGNFYEEKGLELFLRVISLALVLDGFRNINIVALQKQIDFKRISIMEQLVAAASTIGIIALAWYLRSVWALVLGHVLTSVVHVGSSYLVVPGKIRFRFDRRIAGELFSYGKFITGMSIVFFFITEMDNALIGKMLGMEMLGYYVVAFLLANLPVTYISRAASRLMFPAYAELQNRSEELQHAYLLTVQVVTAVTVPAAFGLMILAPEIIGLVYGQNWMPAAAPLQILAFFGACRSITSLNGYLLNGIGRPNVNFYIALLRFGLLPVLLISFTRKWGMPGAAVAVLVPIAIQLLISLIAVCRLTGTRLLDVIKSIGMWTVCSAAMAGVLFAVKGTLQVTIPLLVFLLFLGVGIYLLLTWRRIMALIKHARGLM